MTSELTLESNKGWDPVWEEIFASQQWGKYPPEELIRFVARNYFKVKDRKSVSILELGCGTGACLWFMAREGFSVSGVDGSDSALKQARKTLAEDNLQAELISGDLLNLRELVKEQKFDAVIDIACLQCMRIGHVKEVVNAAYDLLVDGGKIFSIMVSADTKNVKGKEIEPGTFIDITEGPMKGRGLNHLFTKEEVKEVFQKFGSLQVDFVKRSIDNQALFYDNWIVSAEKEQ